MTNNPSDYVRYTIYSKKDPASHDYHRPSYDKDIRNFINNAVKSSLPKDAFYYVGDKQLTKSGQTRIDIYTHKADSHNVGSSLSTLSEELKFKGGAEKYHVTRARPVSDEQYKALKEIEKSKDKEDTETTRFTKGSFLKVIAILTAIANITRRILSSIMTLSQQTVKDMVTAHNLGMSYESVRSYKHIEKAHGMKEGTITGAIADLQTKFGNITSLDEKALEALAVVMGGKIEEMAKMGLGASNPEKILGAILDDFNAKANAGYNSVGQYVGEAQARRELYSYLLKVSPQVADIFATMQEEQHNINSIYRNQADTFEKWKNLNITKRGGNGELDYGVMSTLGQQFNELKDVVSQIWESFAVGFAPALLALTRRIADTRIGMTEEEKRQRNAENKEANAQALSNVRKTMATMEKQGNMSEEDLAYYKALKDYADELEKENKKKTIHNLVATYAEIKLRGVKYLDNVSLVNQANQLMTVGLSVGDIGATDQEIADYVEAYNTDTPEERERFAKYKGKQNKQIVRTIEGLDEEARLAEFASAKRNAEAEVKAEKKDENSLLRKTRDRIAPMYRKRFDLIMSAYKTFNLDYDLSSGLWVDNPEKAMFEAQHWLAGEGYIFEDALGIPYFTSAENKNYKQSQESKDKIREMFPFVSEDDYLYWLYTEHKQDMDDSILGMRVAEQEKRYKQARMADNYGILFDSEGTERDWQAVVAKALAKGGSGRLYAYNTKDSGTGENYLRFRLEIDDNGKVTTKDVYSIFGVTGEEGFMGTATYDKETKQVTLDPASSGSSASQTVNKGD